MYFIIHIVRYHQNYMNHVDRIKEYCELEGEDYKGSIIDIGEGVTKEWPMPLMDLAAYNIAREPMTRPFRILARHLNSPLQTIESDKKYSPEGKELTKIILLLLIVF